MTEHQRSELRVAEDTALYSLASRMTGLSEDGWTALGQTPVVHRFVGRGRKLLDRGARVRHLRVLCKGWALRYLRIDGERRQILGIVLPGDVVGLHQDAEGRAICDVEALTACEVGEIEAASLDRLGQTYPAILFGLREALTEQLALVDDHVMRLGRMTAYERVCSFLLEIYRRQIESVPGRTRVDFPVTQTLLADVLGLSVVHVNRQIMQLRREGAVTLDRRHLTIHDQRRLAEVCGYRDRRFDTSAEALLRAS